MEVGCLGTVAMTPCTILYCSELDAVGGDGIGVSGVAEKWSTENRSMLETAV